MNAEKFLVTLDIKGRSQTKVWDTANPMGIGHPLSWVLERNASGVRIRDLTQNKITATSMSAENSQVAPLQIPDSNIEIRFKKLIPLRAAYLESAKSEPGKTGGLPKLLTFAGVRRSVISSHPIHSAYVAYSKGKPAFSVFYTAEGLKIKLLSNKVKLKLKGKKPFPGMPGEVWTLSRAELPHATITRGWYWWRFSEVLDGVAFAEEARSEKDVFFEKISLALVFAFFMFTAGVFFMRHPEVKEVPIEVQKELPKIVFQKTVILAPHIVKTPPKEEPKPAPKVIEAKQEKPVPPKAVKPAESIQGKPVKPHEVVKIAGGQANAHSKPTVSAAASKLKLFKDALGGAAMLTKKDLNVGGGASTRVAGLFSDHGPAYSATEVKPGFSGSNLKVGKVGGNGTGGIGTGSGNAVGYGTGEHGAVSGQGSSLASIDSGGSTVDEGLTKEEVGAVIHSHMSEIRYCHESAMLSQPNIEGKLILNFSINPVGSVESTSVQSTSLPDRQISDCVIRRLMTWKFPKPRGKVHVAVAYPFLFKTLARE